jgi:DNA repair exonuclease SbcCD ATPase subunit
MNWSLLFRTILLLPFFITATIAQTTPFNQATSAPPVAYSSMSQLNMLLSELERTAQTAQVDLAKMRIEKWKADSNTKRQEQANVESVQRNLQTALPEIIGQIRSSPENLNLTFKLYRNLDALYDVFGSLVESAGAFGAKDDFQSLGNDLNALEKSRRSLADRMETLASAKDGEVSQLRAQLRALQAATPPTPPKKVVVDDTETPKKSTRKKSAPKKSTTPTSSPAPQ